MNAMVHPGDKVLLSLSAGKDSMMLLHLMNILRQETGIEPGIFHLNHCMRGNESDADEDHVRGCADRLGIPFYGERFDFRNETPANRSFEDYARELRYASLERIACSEGYVRIATAHSAGDQVETVLMRILTGTGIHGLRGIDPVHGRIIRPLLCVTSGQVYEFLRDNSIQWREDESNMDLSHPRNFIRHELLPIIKKRFPVERSVPVLSNHAREFITLLDGFVAESGIVTTDNESVSIPYESVAGNFPLLKHVTATYIRKRGLRPLTERGYDEIEKNLKSTVSCVTLYASGQLIMERVKRNGACLIVMHPPVRRAEKQSWEYHLPVDGTQVPFVLHEINVSFVFHQVERDVFKCNRGKSGWIFITMPYNVRDVIIRNRRDGDRILLEAGTCKIKDYFIEKKLDRQIRENIPLLVVDGQVAALMPGMCGIQADRVGAPFLVTDSSEKIFALYSPDAVY